MRPIAVPLIVASVATAAQPARAGPHDHDLLEIGRTAANVLEFHTHAVMPIEMHPSPFPDISGYATAEVAFESLAAPNSHGQFPLLDGADIRVVLVAADPGLTLWDGLTPLGVGDEMVLGAPFFHILPVWSIAPAPPGGVYHATLMARDAAGLHADSPLFEVSFVAVPAPGAATLLALGLAAAHRRRAR